MPESEDYTVLIDTALNVRIDVLNNSLAFQNWDELKTKMAEHRRITVEMTKKEWDDFTRPEFEGKVVAKKSAEMYKKWLLATKAQAVEYYKQLDGDVPYLLKTAEAYAKSGVPRASSFWEIAIRMYLDEVDPAIFESDGDLCETKPTLAAVLKIYTSRGLDVKVAALKLVLAAEEEEFPLYVVFSVK